MVLGRAGERANLANMGVLPSVADLVEIGTVETWHCPVWLWDCVQQCLHPRSRFREGRRLDFSRVGVLAGRCDRRITAQWRYIYWEECDGSGGPWTFN